MGAALLWPYLLSLGQMYSQVHRSISPQLQTVSISGAVASTCDLSKFGLNLAGYGPNRSA